MEPFRNLQATQELDRQGWRDATQVMIDSNTALDTSSKLYGIVLADLVVQKHLRVDDLRGGVSWASAHDREAVRILGPTIDKTSVHPDDYIEAMSRRLAHHAGRWALGHVKNQVKLLTFGAKREHLLTTITQDLIEQDSGIQDYSSRIRVVG